MEFTLPQLTPGNLKLIFEQAAYDVDDCTEHEMDDEGYIKQYGGITVVDDGRRYVISPKNDNDHILFGYNFWLPADEEKDTIEEVFLKVSNIYDHMPVHCKYRGKDDDGDVVFQFINSAIFPEKEAVEGKRLIKIFRTYQRFVVDNLTYFRNVLDKVKTEK